MPQFLQLRGQSAAAGSVVIRRDDLPGDVPDRLGQAIPFHHRIALWVVGVEQLSIFDKQQRIDNELGNVLKTQINPGGMQRGKDGLVVPPPNAQPCLGFFVVDGKKPPG